MSLRPTSLKNIVRILSTLNERGCMSVEELAISLSKSRRYMVEILRELSNLNLVHRRDDEVCIAMDGAKFLELYREGDADKLHGIFMRLEAYRKVYACYVSGLRKAKEIKDLTGLSIVTIDTALRLIREIENIRRGKVEDRRIDAYSTVETKNKLTDTSSYSGDTSRKSLVELLPLFTKTLIECYNELVARRRSKFVPIAELRSAVISRMGITVDEFQKLLNVFVERNRGIVSLAPAPLYARKVPPPIEIHGRKYVYIMLS